MAKGLDHFFKGLWIPGHLQTSHITREKRMKGNLYFQAPRKRYYEISCVEVSHREEGPCLDRCTNTLGPLRIAHKPIPYEDDNHKFLTKKAGPAERNVLGQEICDFVVRQKVNKDRTIVLTGVSSAQRRDLISTTYCMSFIILFLL